jgi:hypothetical protein
MITARNIRGMNKGYDEGIVARPHPPIAVNPGFHGNIFKS